jgi:hypothetical protein
MRARHVLPTDPPPHSGSRERAEGSAPPASAEKVSTRRRRTSRPPVRVDDVGDVAVAIASKAMPSFAPKLLKDRAELTSAPIDHRDAFVMSLIDGKLSSDAIVDISGMPRDHVMEILKRLVQLGIVALP